MFKWIMLAVFIITLLYTMWHLHLGLKIAGEKRRFFWILLCIIPICCGITILVGHFLPMGTLQRYVVQFSNYYLGFWIYQVFFLLLLDIYRLLRYYICKKDIGIHTPAFVIILMLSLVFTVYGGIHARDIKVNTQNVTVHKEVKNLSSMKVVLVSDWHLGYSIGTKDMEKMVKVINRQNPDLVLIAGDIYDNQYDSIDNPKKISRILKRIRSEYGVYGAYGNHDVTETLVGGFTIATSRNPVRDSRVDQMLEAGGVTMLEDQKVCINGQIELVGRLDGEKTGHRNNKRKSLSSVLKGVNRSLPIFVINHEPEDLSEYRQQGVDLVLSGHTHAGQFFPLTITRSLVWSNYWGLEIEGKTTGTVTSGIGVYGPPLRMLSDSEVMVLNVKFEK